MSVSLTTRYFSDRIIFFFSACIWHQISYRHVRRSVIISDSGPSFCSFCHTHNAWHGKQDTRRMTHEHKPTNESNYITHQFDKQYMTGHMTQNAWRKGQDLRNMTYAVQIMQDAWQAAWYTMHNTRGRTLKTKLETRGIRSRTQKEEINLAHEVRGRGRKDVDNNNTQEQETEHKQIIWDEEKGLQVTTHTKQDMGHRAWERHTLWRGSASMAEVAKDRTARHTELAHLYNKKEARCSWENFDLRSFSFSINHKQPQSSSTLM